jgi:hypothetical protein
MKQSDCAELVAVAVGTGEAPGVGVGAVVACALGDALGDALEVPAAVAPLATGVGVAPAAIEDPMIVGPDVPPPPEQAAKAASPANARTAMGKARGRRASGMCKISV